MTRRASRASSASRRAMKRRKGGGRQLGGRPVAGRASHLSSNLFFLYIFGRLVEEEEGTLGLWVTYLVTGAGSNLVSWLLLPSYTVSVGASGAVFGLFVVSVLTRLQWNWRRIVEVVILGQFVVEKVLSEARNSAIMGVGMAAGSGVNHIAHLAGALVGVLLIWMVSRLPDASSRDSGEGSGKNPRGHACPMGAAGMVGKGVAGTAATAQMAGRQQQSATHGACCSPADPQSLFACSSAVPLL
ncbi:unnamed protein product [Closterium sp. NIES-64]|nr:unnamed protein product [Closterium sp. NIES-64]